MDEVSLIRDKIDIVSFLSEYIQLKKSGRNFKALCPFHSEKSPSFMVSPERQIWHCFGCQKGGDIYSFLMEMERIEFPEALRLLAKRAGVELTRRKVDSAATSKKERLYEINSWAKEYYHFILTQHPAGKSGLEYLKKRNVSDKVIESFRLGFAPASGNGLVNYLLKKKGYSKEDLLDAGLVFQHGRDVIDFFRGRLIFPLVDHRDNVVGFSGRILTKDDTGPKYINTRETLIYHKGEHIFGMNLTKDDIRKANQAIIVEGEFDVISCFANGIGNVVAVKGTALTEQHVNLLGRFAQKITFCFDDDAAGQEAIRRSLAVVERKGLTPTVIAIPSGKDPDEALQTDPGLFKKAVKEDISVYDYLLETMQASVDLQTATGKEQLAQALLPLISQIHNEIVKEHYLRKLSNVLDTSYESISKELQRLTQRVNEKNIITQTPVKRSREEVLEEYLLALILQTDDPKTAVTKAMSILQDYFFVERAFQKVILALQNFLKQFPEFSDKAFRTHLGTELLSTYDTSTLLPLPKFSDQEKRLAEIEKTAVELRRLSIQQRLKQLAQQIATLEKEGNEEQLVSLTRQYSQLTSVLQK